ncbi:hypothetical protein ACP3TJ_11845 [Desulforudis sp. 1088]|uniref:hypothetical protein n=1 Tax=unclassified Candidatus Desulforudis TaxID=2635950 RepID=UPI003CE46989
MRTLAYFLIAVGTLIFAGYALYGLCIFIGGAGVPLAVRVGVAALLLGLAALLLALWIERAKEGDKG